MTNCNCITLSNVGRAGLFVLLLATGTQFAAAQVFTAAYSFTGGSLTVDSQPSGATFGPVTAHGGITIDNNQDFITTEPWPETGVIDPTKYIQFNIFPGAGNQVTLSVFRFDHRVGPGANSPDNLRIAVFDTLNPPDLAIPNRAADFTSQSSGFETQTYNLVDFTFSAPGTARFYGWNGGGGHPSFDLDNMHFVGSVSPIPEPRFYAMAAGLGLAAFGVGRRYWARGTTR